MAGCGSKTDPNAGANESSAPESKEPANTSLKIGMTTMGEASFWDAVAQGVKNVLREGDELIFVEGEHGNAAGQVDIIEDFISQGCDLVLFNPVDADAASSCLDLLEDAGIPVINFDSPATDMSTVESFCATDNYAAGALAADFMMSEHPDGGKVAILVYQSAASCVARVEGFKSVVQASDKWEIVTELDGGNTTDAAMPVAEDILTAYPDVDCIFSGNDEMALGAYSAITGAGMDVHVYSVNGGPEAKAKMLEDGEDGIWRATAAQSPILMGEESMKLGYRYLDGETIEKEYLIDAFIISPANIEEYGHNEWQ
jgi:ribose transport system substrate-binding protein